jgi:hypothetical protein
VEAHRLHHPAVQLREFHDPAVALPSLPQIKLFAGFAPLWQLSRHLNGWAFPVSPGFLAFALKGTRPVHRRLDSAWQMSA